MFYEGSFSAFVSRAMPAVFGVGLLFGALKECLNNTELSLKYVIFALVSFSVTFVVNKFVKVRGKEDS